MSGRPKATEKVMGNVRGKNKYHQQRKIQSTQDVMEQGQNPQVPGSNTILGDDRIYLET